jgi:signal transduction histidine kinase
MRSAVTESKLGKEKEMSPGFYQSNWFWVAGIAAGLGGLCLLHLLRVSQVRAGMEGRLAEKDRIAQDLLHTMLQNVQGLILKIHAVAKQMAPEDPMRQALENTLDRADEVLAESSNQLRSLLGPDSLSDLPADVSGSRKNR